MSRCESCFGPLQTRYRKILLKQKPPKTDVLTHATNQKEIVSGHLKPFLHYILTNKYFCIILMTSNMYKEQKMFGKDDKQPKDLTDFELNSLIDKYYDPCVSFLTPVGIECLLIAFSPTVGQHIKNVLKIRNADQIQQAMKDALDEFLRAEYSPGVYHGIMYLTDDDEYHVDYAAILTQKSDVQRLLACFQNRNRKTDSFGDEILEHCRPVLNRYNLTFETLFPEEHKKFKENFSFNIQKTQKTTSHERPNTPFFDSDTPFPKPSSETNAIGFGINLTEQVKELSEPPIFDRDQEINQIQTSLLKRNRGNVMLIGKNGTGKTALVEGLAYNIVNGRAHPLLKDTQIISINLGNLLANTQYRGQLEGKLVHMMETIAENNYILFLDEIHTLFSRRAQDDNIADIMKPYLTNGKIRIIGATTDTEFLQMLRDGAFMRRFNQITVSEPTAEMTLDILRKTKSSYEKNYAISIPDEVLEDIVQKSKAYIHNRNFPDKAIDLLNYVCVLASEKDKTCSIELVNKTLIDMFNVPPALLEIAESMHIATLQGKLNRSIFGQENAITQVANILVDSYIMHTDRTPEPQASFLFCGPSGVGKTKTAEAIAQLLGRKLAVVNMNEYQHEMDVNKLTGAAPGYTGYESGGRLTSIIKDNPYSVILFDEIEKAHQDVQRLLLQILDKGTFTDSQGLTLKFSNTIIIMATNAGVQYDQPVGFNAPEGQELTVSEKALQQIFLPEFLGRINQIVTFNSLTPDALKQIVNTLCYELNASMEQEYNIGVSISQDVQDFVIDQGYNIALGARRIKNTFKKLVEVPVAHAIIDKYKDLTNKQEHAQIIVNLVNQQIACNIEHR